MLNISTNDIKENIDVSKYETLSRVDKKASSRVLAKILTVGSFIFFVTLFLPWTQNIRSAGNVATLLPNQKPQTINSFISGRIEKWFVQEGEMIRKGDTIALLSEIKAEYLDPELLSNTREQMDLNISKSKSYKDKILSQNSQLAALKRQRDLKLEQNAIKLQQYGLKIEIDSMTYVAAQLDYTTAFNQFVRTDTLYRLGLKTVTDLEIKRLKKQATNAYLISAKNKWINTKNDYLNLKIDNAGIRTKYQNDASKINAEIFTSLSNQLEAETSVSKLKNKYSNVSARQGMYYVLSPQDCYVTKTYYSGIGETVKEGSAMVSIMPRDYELAIQLYIDPIDLPLIELGRKVRIQFDGWPAIVFSGWPQASYGTYEGTVYAIDQFISENGKYRILVSEDDSEYPWPKALRFGGGTNNLIMLKDVPIWYELWRNINGFPPDFYAEGKKAKSKK
ncbi:MAG: biotin/lipoyl-binding protein [Flavobacteriales bacterium]